MGVANVKNDRKAPAPAITAIFALCCCIFISKIGWHPIPMADVVKLKALTSLICVDKIP